MTYDGENGIVFYLCELQNYRITENIPLESLLCCLQGQKNEEKLYVTHLILVAKTLK